MDEESSNKNRPECRAGHITVMAGKYVLVWGGYNDEDNFESEYYIPPDELWIWDTHYGTCKQWVIAVEYYEGNCRHCVALATCPVYRPSQDLQALGYGNNRCAFVLRSEGSRRQWIHIQDGGPPTGLSGAVGVLAIAETDRGSRHRALFIIGGHSYGGSMNSVYQLSVGALFLPNPSTSHLTCKNLSEEDESRTFSPRDKFTGWEHEGNIYIFGGFGPDIRHYLCDIGDFVLDMDANTNRGWNNQLLKYDVRTSKWSLPDVKGSIPLPRAAHGVAKLGNELYMFGGRHKTHRLNDLHVLDMSSFTWTKITIFDNVPIGRSWHSFNRISDHQIFLFGGYSDASNPEKPLGDAWLLDVKSRMWTQMTTDECKNHSRLWHTGVQTEEGEVTIFGGCLNDILHSNVPKHSNSVITFRIVPKSLVRLSMDATFLHRSSLHGHYSSLPRELQNELLDREISAQSFERLNSLQSLD